MKMSLTGVCVLLSAIAAPFAYAIEALGTNPDFNSEVRPILSKYCFKCHGPDDKARKGKLRFDVRENALQAAKSGELPIVPGQVEKSELVKRIFAADEEDVMPPPSTKNQLLPEQKELLKRWIASGAEYQPHWAFVAPKQAQPPAVKLADWPRNAIDRFILARLEAEGMQPSPPAGKYALARRVYLDLTGLPPTPDEAEAFVMDASPEAYEKLVDRLLASPQYGERWARRWLDLARYADTNGYEKDRQRSIWPYRDWVIQAINADMPFDQFTIQQIAGDMLPHPTSENLIATGFHRNTMLNEEGGIDPLEFRYYSLVDRVSTTGKTWLGLTLQCAQCHTHKFDPITHREYYQMMAFFNNSDEPEYKIKPPDFEQTRAEKEAQIAKLIAELPNRFPAPETMQWSLPEVARFTTVSGERAEKLGDGSWILRGPPAEKDTYVIELDTALSQIDAIQLTVLADEALSRKGPGRSDSGNFVLNQIRVSAAAKAAPEKMLPVKIKSATADFSQSGHDVNDALTGTGATGWGIAPQNQSHTATFALAQPIQHAGGAHLRIELKQEFGGKHTIGRLVLRLGHTVRDAEKSGVRKQLLEKCYAAWLAEATAGTVHWTPLRPAEMKTNLPLLTVLDDLSIFASGDHTKSDTYELKFNDELRGVSAIRLEAIPDERLPGGGPGRTFYEGTPGDFSLSELTASAADKPLTFAGATESFADGGNTAANAIDGKPDTNWTIGKGEGKYHTAVFKLAQPLNNAGLRVKLLFERHFCASLGRFRISVTTDPAPTKAHEIPPELEAALLTPADKRSPEQREKLFREFLLSTPELASARGEIDALQRSLKSFQTTLIFSERPPGNGRETFIHNRGEYLQLTDKVEPDVLKVLNPLPQNLPRNRLGLARWLVSPENPLTARVTVNRQWASFFGCGIVKTVEDFGYQGNPPTNQPLLDWLAVEFVKQGWSIKKIHKLIVMSATYQQASRSTPEQLAKDPVNVLLARAPRVRLDAEQIRDSILRASNLLTQKIGGPSVFPPQPANITTEGAYGALKWAVSQGPERYRRGLYTFSKRTAPYAMFGTFDGPSGESCIAQRETSNSPLQALTMLNDGVVLEAAQALGREFSERAGPEEQRTDLLVRRCLTRPAEKEELALLRTFLKQQKERFSGKQLDPAALAGKGAGDAAERAAWTALARALLNLDEMITKN